MTPALRKLLLGLGLVVALWVARYQIRNLLFGVKPPSTEDSTGEWVGTFTMDPKYYAARLYGDTQGPHRQMLLFCRLGVTDGFLDHYGGPCRIQIVGEEIERTGHIGDFEKEPGDEVQFSLMSDPQLLNTAHGEWVDRAHANFPKLESLVTSGELHRGTWQDYVTLKQQASKVQTPQQTP